MDNELKDNLQLNAKECEKLYKELEGIVKKLENSNDADLNIIVTSVVDGLNIQKILKERFENLKEALEKNINV